MPKASLYIRVAERVEKDGKKEEVFNSDLQGQLGWLKEKSI